MNSFVGHITNSFAPARWWILLDIAGFVIVAFYLFDYKWEAMKSIQKHKIYSIERSKNWYTILSNRISIYFSTLALLLVVVGSFSFFFYLFSSRFIFCLTCRSSLVWTFPRTESVTSKDIPLACFNIYVLCYFGKIFNDVRR